MVYLRIQVFLVLQYLKDSMTLIKPKIKFYLYCHSRYRRKFQQYLIKLEAYFQNMFAEKSWSTYIEDNAKEVYLTFRLPVPRLKAGASSKAAWWSPSTTDLITALCQILKHRPVVLSDHQELTGMSSGATVAPSSGLEKGVNGFLVCVMVGVNSAWTVCSHHLLL